jgi:hypothetical protein
VTPLRVILDPIEKAEALSAFLGIAFVISGALTMEPKLILSALIAVVIATAIRLFSRRKKGAGSVGVNNEPVGGPHGKEIDSDDSYAAMKGAASVRSSDLEHATLKKHA